MKRRRVLNGALLGVPEAAVFLGSSERSLRWHVARGLVPYRKLGARIVFRRAELESFVEALPGVTLKDARHNAQRRKER